jgi:pimeloyl-ACP methyl ester carboxylesterase
VLGIGRIALSPTCSESGREEISIVKNDEIANARAGGASDRGGPQLPGQSQIDGGRWASRSTRIALGSTAALVALAAAVNWAARRIERSHPPMGNFIEVDGVRVHYVDVGEGEPVVLLHGNASMLQDPYLGLLDGLAGRHRVIAFDRPGFGYSERPKNVTWTPEAQMKLLRGAFTQLGIERPVLYGHSWGAPLVVTYALHHPEDIRGVVAASGYYYPNRRLDAAMAVLNGAPVIGPIFRNTISPVMNAIMGPLALRLLFSPNPVPPTYAEFPASMTLRPVAIRAAGEDGMTLRDWAARTSPRYGEIRAPVVIVAGTDDKAVDYRGHSVRLHREIPGSRLHIWPNTGHMVHHSRTEEVIQSIEEVFEMAGDRSAASAGSAVAE